MLADLPYEVHDTPLIFLGPALEGQGWLFDEE